MTDELRPRREIRRFDVFAEYNKLKAMADGRPLDEAKGYGLWLAKVVASRRYGVSPPPRTPDKDRKEGQERDSGTQEKPEAHEPFRSLGDELQTDERFDQEIVDRMGERFYNEVFAPAIAERFKRGDRYESIRDVVRKGWKPV